MAGKRIRNIRDRVTGAFGISFRRVNQLCCLLQIFLCCEYQHVNLLLTQSRRQAHNAFQAVRTHHARFLIAKIVAREERRWRHVLIEDQDVWRKHTGLFVYFAGQRQGQFTNVRRYAISRNRARNPRHVQLLAPHRELSRLRFGLINRRPCQLLECRCRDSGRSTGILWHEIHVCKGDGRNTG